MSTRGVLLGEVGPCVEDLEAAVAGGGQLQIVPGIGSGNIGDVAVGGVPSSAFVGEVELPERLQAGGRRDCLQGRDRATLGRSVIHDGDARADGVDQCGTGALVPAVMRDDEDVDVTDLIPRAHQLHLLVPRKVAEVEDLQLAEGNFSSEGSGVLGLVGGTHLRDLAEGIGLTGVGQGAGNEVAVGADDTCGEAGDGEKVAGLGDDVFVVSAGKDLLVLGVAVLGDALVKFTVGAVVYEGTDRDAGDQLWNAADVVGVIVGEKEVIDLRDAGVPGDGYDAVGVAAFVAGPSGIDEQRLPVRCDEERGLPTFDIDEVDLQLAVSLVGDAGLGGCSGRQARSQQGQERKSDASQGRVHDAPRFTPHRKSLEHS